MERAGQRWPTCVRQGLLDGFEANGVKYYNKYATLKECHTKHPSIRPTTFVRTTPSPPGDTVRCGDFSRDDAALSLSGSVSAGPTQPGEGLGRSIHRRADPAAARSACSWCFTDELHPSWAKGRPGWPGRAAFMIFQVGVNEMSQAFEAKRCSFESEQLAKYVGQQILEVILTQSLIIMTTRCI